MYLGFLLILLSVAFLLGTLTPFAVVPAFAALLEVTCIKPEDRFFLLFGLEDSPSPRDAIPPNRA